MTTKEISETAILTARAHELLHEDSTPAVFLETLEKQELFDDAVRFLAHKLSAEAGVKWALACFRELESPEQKARKDESKEAAENWTLAPSDTTRWAARDAADRSTVTSPANLLAMGVFMSGGSISPPQSPEIQPPPYTAQKMISGCVTGTVLMYQPENAAKRYKRALELGREADRS